MHRFYQEISIEGADEFELKDTNIAHQIGRVLRIREGEQIAVFNGSGVDYICEILETSKRSVRLKVVDQIQVDAERKVSVHLFQAIPHTWSKFEDVLKKCTELGVTDFYPLLLDRCEMRSPLKKDRLNKIIIEACEQCGASILPKLHNIISLKEATKIASGKKIMAYEGETSRGVDDFEFDSEVSLFIGPEGGITEEEAKVFEDNGGFLFNLGKRILRTETAPVAIVGKIVL